MEVLQNFVKGCLEENGAFPIVIFGSAVHGSGRSFLANQIAEILKDSNIPTLRISTGEIFREMAQERGMSIDDLAEMQREHPEEFLEFNLAVDKEIHGRMIENSEKTTVVVDSNLAAYHADTPNAYAILVHAQPEIIAKRVFEGHRRGDGNYKTPEDAWEAMLKRTRADIYVYRRASALASDNFWKMVYRVAANDMDKILRSVLEGKTPESPFYNATVDNSGSAEESISQIIEFLRRHV